MSDRVSSVGQMSSRRGIRRIIREDRQTKPHGKLAVNAQAKTVPPWRKQSGPAYGQESGMEEVRATNKALGVRSMEDARGRTGLCMTVDVKSGTARGHVVVGQWHHRIEAIGATSKTFRTASRSWFRLGIGRLQSKRGVGYW